MTRSLTNDQILLKQTILPHEAKQAQGVLKESSFFEYFAATQWLKKCDFSSEEILMGVVGESNDGGCDGLYITYNGILVREDNVDTIQIVRGATMEMFILQAKEEFSFGEDAIMKLKTVSKNLLKLDVDEEDYKTRYSESVRAAFSLFRKLYAKAIIKPMSMKFHYAYVSLAQEVHPNVQEQANELKIAVQACFSNAEVDFEFIGASKLLTLHQADNKLLLTLPLAASAIMYGDKNQYVALVRLTDYFSFIADSETQGGLRKALFEANVRDYQGGSINVNKKIQDTLCNNKHDDFWWLNNGITILAQRVEFGGMKLVVESPEIVNGLQTTMEVYAFFRNHPEALQDENRSLLVRIIVPETEETRDNIIYATNNQTPVNSASLRVTHSIHRKIEAYCKAKGLYYDRRKNQYKNEGHLAAEIVSVLFLGQCMVSILLQLPDYARARPSTILADDEKYRKLYNENVPLVVFYNCARIGQIVNAELLRREDLSTTGRRNILFHTIYAVAASLAQKTAPTERDVERFSLERITPDLVEKMTDVVFDIFKRCGGDDKAAKGHEFTQELAEWLNEQFAENGAGVLP